MKAPEPIATAGGGKQTSLFGGPWMVTFADLMSLLLAFFVLVFSMSKVKVEAWQAMVESIADPAASAVTGQPLGPNADKNVARIFPMPATELEYMQVVLQRKVMPLPLLRSAAFTRHSDRLVVTLAADPFFQGGSPYLNRDGELAARDIGGLLWVFGNRIEVAVHGDPTTTPAGWRSNWDFTTERAIAFAKAMAKGGVKRPVGAVGMADSRFYDVDPSLTYRQRLRLARRVEIVIFQDGAVPEK